MGYKIFVINPGSTSTKLAYFDDDKKLFEENVFHDSSELAKFVHISEQFDFRLRVIKEFLEENNIDLHGVDAIVGRGGGMYSVESGTYEIDDLLYDHTKNNVFGAEHPCVLGIPLAKALQQEFGGRAFMVDAPNVDELQDLARVTGLKGVYRGSSIHTLNQKGTARKYCAEHGKKYEEGNFIVCHIDGGISVAAHRKGKMVDANGAGHGEGPYTPTRIGTMQAVTLLNLIGSGKMSVWDLRLAAVRSGGFVSHFGTSNSDYVHGLMEQGDKYADLVWKALVYNICKNIGAMATVLCGKVDAIVLGGGLLRFDDLVQQIKDQCEWIAPVYSYPGEVEHEAMAAGALRVLRGEEEPKIYTGKPVWDGFDFEPKE